MTAFTSRLAALAAAAVLATALAGCMDSGKRTPPPPIPEVVNCAESGNAQSCLECGSGGNRLSCCQHPSSCTVIDAVSGAGQQTPPQSPAAGDQTAPPTATPTP